MCEQLNTVEPLSQCNTLSQTEERGNFCVTLVFLSTAITCVAQMCSRIEQP